MNAQRTSPKRAKPAPGRVRRLRRTLRQAKQRLTQDRFTREVHDLQQAVSLDLDVRSSTLLITFGGMARNMGIPPFEFFAATREIPTKRMFVRDLRQAWYHKGIDGYGRSLPAAAEALAELIAEHHVERIVTVGTSAGGYGALAFGTLLGAEKVLSFAPQTVIAPEQIAAMGDHRWDEPLQALARERALDPRWTDLREALPRERRSDTRYEVYFAQHNSKPGMGPGRDRMHAERLREVPGVRLYRFGRGGHLVVRTLREAGALDKVLRRALLHGGEPAAAPAREAGASAPPPV